MKEGQEKYFHFLDESGTWLRANRSVVFACEYGLKLSKSEATRPPVVVKQVCLLCCLYSSGNKWL